jgi:hypothetical protein
MADAMKAQMEMLTGKTLADDEGFEELYASALGEEGGTLADIMRKFEAPLRKETAQIDTDVMRQTILGGSRTARLITEDDVEAGLAEAGDIGKVGMPEAESTYRKGSKELTGEAKSAQDQYQFAKAAQAKDERGEDVNTAEWRAQAEKLGINATMRGKMLERTKFGVALDSVYAENFAKFSKEIQDSGGSFSESPKFITTNPKTGEAFKEGEVVRAEEGMIDLLGDTRGVQEAVRSEDYAKYVKDYPDLQADFNAKRKADPSLTIEEYGQAHYERWGQAEGRELAMGGYTMQDVGRTAGFDESGKFRGLSALAEDVQAGHLSRQRERDLQDVSRLSGLYSDIMQDYKPGTKAALADASKVLEAQKATLTGAGAIDAPASVAGGLGAITGTGVDPLTASRADALKAATGYKADPTAAIDALTAETGYEAASAAEIDPLTAAISYDPSVGITGGQIGADTLRKALMSDAETSLAGGLTQREQRQISEAFKAQSTMMGRTFDQAGGLAEAKARTLEDRNRQALNRQYAQRVLGQEAGLQESDLGRGLQASLANQQAANRAAEYGVGAGLQREQAGAQFTQQKSLADQQAANQAAQYGVGAGLQREQVGAQFAQQKALADQQAANRAAEYGIGAGLQREQAGAQLGQQMDLAEFAQAADAAQYTAQEDIQAQLANEANRQQAASFDVNALQQQQRLNEQLKQAGTLGYVDAATRLAALEDTTTLDPFQAVLGRAGGGSLAAGQSVFGQAGYGLQSGPQYLNPEAGLGFIQNQATNAANMFNAQQAAGATRSAGMMGGLGALGGGLLGGLFS